MRGFTVVWQLGGFDLILNAEYGCYKKISTLFFYCLPGRGKLELETSGVRFSLTS